MCLVHVDVTIFPRQGYQRMPCYRVDVGGAVMALPREDGKLVILVLIMYRNSVLYSPHIFVVTGSDHIVIIAAVLCVLCVLVIVVASTTIYLRKRKLNMTNARPSIMNEAPQPYAVYENAQDNAHVYLGIDPYTESTDDYNAKEYVLTEQGHSDTNGNVPSRPEGGEGWNYQKF